MSNVIEDDAVVCLCTECSSLGKGLEIFSLDGKLYHILLLMVEDGLKVNSLLADTLDCEDIFITDTVVCTISLVCISDDRKHHARLVAHVDVIHRDKHIHREKLLRTFIRNGEHHSDVTACV